MAHSGRMMKDIFRKQTPEGKWLTIHSFNSFCDIQSQNWNIQCELKKLIVEKLTNIPLQGST